MQASLYRVGLIANTGDVPCYFFSRFEQALFNLILSPGYINVVETAFKITMKNSLKLFLAIFRPKANQHKIQHQTKILDWCLLAHFHHKITCNPRLVIKYEIRNVIFTFKPPIKKQIGKRAFYCTNWFRSILI